MKIVKHKTQPMIQTIFIIYGLLMFTDIIFEKWNIWDAIAKAGSDSESKWFFTLTTCRFCLLFHIGWIFTILFGCFAGFSWSLLIVPFVVGGFIHITQKDGL